MEKYTLPVVIEKDEYGYFAMCPALQGCYLPYWKNSTSESCQEYID